MRLNDLMTKIKDSQMTRDVPRHGRRLVMVVLGFTQIMAWGSSYYLPAVLTDPIARDTGWQRTWIVGGLSLGLLMAALISPRVGSEIERRGGRNVLALSAVTIGLGQVGLAIAPNLALYISAWLVIGIGMGAGLYDAAFATLGRLYGRDARAAITTLTLFGGFASTVCWPLSALLVSEIGWRGACLAYAAIQLTVSLPLYLFVVPHYAPDEPVPVHSPQPTASSIDIKPSRLLLAILAFTLTLAAVISSLMSVHLLTILQASGVGLASAVGLGALVGPSQVAARSVEMGIARYHHPIWTKIASASFVAIGLCVLCSNLPLIPVALGFYGAGIGLESIARGTLPLALFGPSGYARLMGRLALPSLVAQATAPWVGAVLIERVGSQGTLTVLACAAVFNIVLAAGLSWMVVRQPTIPQKDS
jgi:MFS family permease